MQQMDSSVEKMIVMQNGSPVNLGSFQSVQVEEVVDLYLVSGVCSDTVIQ